MVDLIRTYSNRDAQGERVAALVEMTPARHVERARRLAAGRWRVHKLRRDEVDELVAGYQAGISVKHLGERFGLNRATVGKHRRARGIQTFPPGLEEADLPEAVRLCRDRWSLARIATKFGSTDKTIRKRLLAAGARMRDPWGWERQGYPARRWRHDVAPD